MKVLVLSDIHSNIWGLRDIWDAESGADKVLCAGDLVDYGPFPGEVIRWMREREAAVVAGNHDRRLVQAYRAGDFRAVAPHQRKWVHENCSKLEEADVNYLEGLPDTLCLEIDGYAYTIRHAFRGYDTMDALYQFDGYSKEHCGVLFLSHPRQRLIFGHTHRPGVHFLADHKLWLNPGSASYRRPDDPRKTAQYIIIQEGQISLREVEYDRSPLLSATLHYAETRGLEEAEIQDALFFFGDAEQPAHR